MKVRFNLKDPSKPSTLVYAILRYNGYRLKYSTQTEVQTKYWNPDAQRIRQTSKVPSYPEINNFFDVFAHGIIGQLKKFQSKGIVPTSKQFREELDKHFQRKKVEDDKTFFGFFDRYIDIRANHPDKPLKPATLKIFTKTLDHLREFQSKTDWSHIDLTYYNRLLKFFFDKKSLNKNSAGKYIKVLKQIINAAKLEGIEVNPIYQNFVVPKSQTYGIYYTESELIQLERFDFGTKKYLGKARDHFILQSYIGARYQDYMELGKANIKTIEGQKIIFYSPNKANKKTIVSIPFHPIAERILKKYQGRFPSPISNQRMNDFLKDMARIAGFNQEIIFPSSNGGDTQVFKKWELTTTHTARRNLVTNAIKSGMSESDVMLLSGHRSLSAFRLYNKTTPEENASRIAKTSFFKPLKVAK